MSELNINNTEGSSSRFKGGMPGFGTITLPRRKQTCVSAPVPAVCYVYLMIHDSQSRFKIGLSLRPVVRMQQLPEADDVAVDRSVRVELPNFKRARQVESMLHKALAGFRLKLLDEDGQSWDGSTEWFNLAGLSNAINLLRVMPVANEPFVLANLETFMGEPYRHAVALDIPTPAKVRKQPFEDLNMRRMLAIFDVLNSLRQLFWMDVRQVNDRSGPVECLCIHDFRKEVDLGLMKVRNEVFSNDFWALSTGNGDATVPLVRLIRYSLTTPGTLELVINNLAVIRKLPAGDRVAAVWQGHLAWLSSMKPPPKPRRKRILAA